jgi:hypothetical protein
VLVSYADTDHRYLFYLSFAALGLRDAAILVMLNNINSLLDTSNNEAAFGCTAAHRRHTRFSRLSATDGTGRAPAGRQCVFQRRPRVLLLPDAVAESPHNARAGGGSAADCDIHFLRAGSLRVFNRSVTGRAKETTVLAAAGDASRTVLDAAAGGEMTVVAFGGGHEADERANRSDVDSSDHGSVEAPSTEQMLPPSSAGVVRWRNDGCRDGRCDRHRIESHADTIALATARCVTTLPVQHEKMEGAGGKSKSGW